jgi:predicted O-methyltransferase YrrM
MLGSSFDDDISLVRSIKRALLRPMKAAAKAGLRQLSFRRHMNQAARSPSLLDDPAFLAEIRQAWGNVAYSGDVSLLIEALGRVRGGAGGAVLECGSGISTILLSLAMPRRPGCEIWALENDVRWFERVASVTRQYQLGNVQLVHAPLRSYGDYMWYAAPLQRMPRFHLVICDGPTEATRGGRYGLLPVMAPRLADDAVVLVDDADTAVGRGVLARWADEGLARVELREGPDGAFAIVTLQKHASAAAHSIT